MTDTAIKIQSEKADRPHLFFLGQAGFVIKSISGELLGIDLYLSECVERVEGHIGYKRLLPKVLDPFDLQFNGIVATHPHYDHFDMDAIPQLMSNMKTRLFASVNCRKEVQRLLMPEERVAYVKPGKHCVLGDFSLSFTNCDHGKGAPDAVGVLVTVDGKRILEVGDTCLRLDRVGEYLAEGPIDVLIAPINGAFGNMDEADCAKLANALQPKLTIPCHYGMFASHGGNPGVFHAIMSECYPNNYYLLMAIGESLAL